MRIAKLHTGPEIFYSIQGEGKNTGRPSIFLRTSLCNLHCVWCDTDYTWNWEGTRFQHVRDSEPGYSKYKMEDCIIDMNREEIINYLKQFDCKNIIFTGGEPMMQQEELTALMKSLRTIDPGYHFEIETNGTITPTEVFDQLIDQYNVSPKLENSGNKRSLREKPEAYRFFAANPKVWFKFVMANKTDQDELLELIDRYQLLPERIFLMPEGTSEKDLIEKEAWLVELCKKYGFNFSTRLHIHLFGNKRGV